MVIVQEVIADRARPSRSYRGCTVWSGFLSNAVHPYPTTSAIIFFMVAMGDRYSVFAS